MAKMALDTLEGKMLRILYKEHDGISFNKWYARLSEGVTSKETFSERVKAAVHEIFGNP